LFTLRVFAPTCWPIPGVGIIAGVEDILLTIFWFVPIPLCPDCAPCEPVIRPPCAIAMLFCMLAKEDDTATFELPDTVEVFDPKEPRPAPIGCTVPDIEVMMGGVDVMPLDIIFDMCTCIGVAPMLGPIEVTPGKESRCCDKLFKMLLTFAGPPGRPCCWIGFIKGLCSCKISFAPFVSCEIIDGEELCMVVTPCEVTFEIGVIWENAGAETIAGTVVGSTLTFAVGCRPISDPFTEELTFEVGPGTLAAGAVSIFVMVWFGTRFGKE
jgi:hypothetical protein